MTSRHCTFKETLFINRIEIAFAVIMVLAYLFLISTLVTLNSWWSNAIFWDTSDNLRDLKLVHVISRHGARNPIFVYPNDPHKNHQYFGGLGALTNLGKRQQYNLGKCLRNRYRNFLTSNPKEVYARSSSTDRTIESALSALAGLYPPECEWRWSKNLEWQPIPVYTVPEVDDSLLHPNAKCEAYTKGLNTMVVNESQDLKDFIKFISEKTGMEMRETYYLLLIYSTLESQIQEGLRLPEWASEEVLEKLRKAGLMVYHSLYGSTKFKKFRGGPLVKEIISNVQKMLEGSLKHKQFFWYSTHDATMVAFMKALNVFNEKLPPFSATIIVETHSSNRGHFLRILYSNSTSLEFACPELYQLNIPQCPLDCPLDEFIKLTASVVPVNWMKECSD